MKFDISHYWKMEILLGLAKHAVCVNNSLSCEVRDLPDALYLYVLSTNCVKCTRTEETM
jgi:hypothetical protein